MASDLPTPASTRYQAVAVVGATASGKTALAIELATRLDTEIISADSMQFYRGMDIGTAAPTSGERAAARHHFVGFLDPDQHYSAGAFASDAMGIVEDLNRRDRIAVIAGGSALYVSALLDGLFDGPARDELIRERLHGEAADDGVEAMYARLQAVDPGYAAIVAPRDLRRIVRGLEVFELTGEPISHLHKRHQEEKEPLSALLVAVDWPRDALYDRINRRVDRMVELGLLDEVQGLLDEGYGDALDRLKSLGYREIAAYLRGEQTLEEAIEQTKMFTRRFAKRQLSWYRGDDRVHWLPIADYPDAPSQANAALALLQGNA